MLQLKRITKVYKTKKGVSQLALNEVELNFADKGLYFIVGPSGCGKSTLMNIIGGMDNFTSGEFLIDGKSSIAYKPRDFDNYRNKKIGVVFQNFNLLKELSIKDNIKLSLQLQNKKISDAEIIESIEQVGLVAGMEKRMPTQLSGGQQQRIAIARALIKKPQIILADEPTGNLDQTNSIQIFDLLKNLSQDKLVIVVTHNLQLAKRYADTLIIMQDGKVKKIATRGESVKYAPNVSSNNKEKYGESSISAGAASFPIKERKAVLSFSKRLSFAFLILKKNWFKTVLLFVMFTFSITMAGIGITASRYDKVKTTLDTYNEAKITNYYIGDDFRYALNADGYEENRTEGSTAPFINTQLSPEKQDDLKNKISEDKLIPMYASDMYCGTYGDVEYFMPVNEANFEKLGYKILDGRLPTNVNEIALSHESYKRLALQFRDDAGTVLIGWYLQFDGSRPVAIGKTPNRYYDNYQIVGFVDTGILAYENLCKKSYDATKNEYEYNWKTALQRELNSGKHCLAFFVPEFFEGKYQNMQKPGINVRKYDKTASTVGIKTFYPSQLFSPNNYTNMQARFAELNDGKSLNENLKFYNLSGVNIDNLKDNEIICNFETMRHIYSESDNGVAFDDYEEANKNNYAVYTLAVDAARLNYNSERINVDKNTNLTNKEKDLRKAELLKEYQTKRANFYKEYQVNNTPLVEEYSRKMFDSLKGENGFTYESGLLHDWKSGRQIYRGSETIKVKVVGFYNLLNNGVNYGEIFENEPLKEWLPIIPGVDIPEKEPVKLGNAFASESLYKNMSYNIGVVSYMLTNPELVDMNYINASNYTIDLLYKGDLQIADIRATTLKQVSTWLSLAFGLISLFLMANYFISTVRENQKQVGILRAMGASVKDTLAIFLLEGVFIALMVSILAIGFIFPMSYLLEGKINLAFLAPIFPSAQTMQTASSQYAISLIKTLTIGWQEIIAMTAISFSFATIFTLAPLLIMLNKKPVEMLRRK